MSVSFYAFRIDSRGRRVRVNPGAVLVDSACLCAQEAPSWDVYLEGTDRLELRDFANPKCAICEGTGVDAVEEGGIEINLNNRNARALLELLGLADAYLCGEVSIVEARRATIRARATFETLAPELAEEGREVFRRVVANRGDGVTSIERRRTAVIGELTVEDLEGRLVRFSAFVEAASREGADSIAWG